MNKAVHEQYIIKILINVCSWHSPEMDLQHRKKNGSLIPIDFFPIHIGIREMNARVPLFTNIFLFANEYQMNRAGKNELTFD